MGFWSGFCWLVVWSRRTGGLVVISGCFSLGDGGLGSGGLKCGFTTGFWRGEGAWNWPEMEKKGLVVVTEKWSFGGCFGGVSPENGENEWGLLELDLGF
ncbi:hypothetical protein KY290_037195 [Solanum tuberosum]|uniref:Uncharacterized protein n=1 Tax=Solanum tuberosum TaxID=4113 RepID=A0ABQ7TV92_SOLTU|nr:hypothetical protein KY289_036715 [Solanum tuberosum]KAH0639934.1 hypothetical protein KY285_036520 [Solanum tuberosum]KAH0738490.1 hypothetical protein KY290_037195 [Solanum tuberosum]